jgi:ADP-ribosyl-[dinitrogen reductase] hydrolase
MSDDRDLDAQAGVSYQQALAVAIEAAKEAGALLRAELHRPTGPRGSGSHAPADEEAEALVRQRLEAAFPEHGVRGEELPGRDRPARDAEGHVWLVDPNDGTVSFLKGLRGSAVSIALLRSGKPVLGVVYAYSAPDDAGDLFAWAEGTGPLQRNGVAFSHVWAERLEAGHTVLVSQDADASSLGNARCCLPARYRNLPSIAYRLALAAAGDAEAAVSLSGPGALDVAAGHALLRGAGGVLLAAGGRPVVYTPEGQSSPANCFGGGPAAARELAGRDWSAVFSASTAKSEPFELTRPVRGKLVADPGRLSRAHGCLLGQLAGDALGSLVEFQPAAAIRAAHPGGVRLLADGGCWSTIAGQPTDDSELALMLARSLTEQGGFDDEAVARAYAYWLGSHPFDCGTTTSTALRPAAAAVAAGGSAAGAARGSASQASQANGALMRVSPLGIFGQALAPEHLAELARRDAALTHPHPVCRDASAVFAVMLARAVAAGPSPQELLAWTLAWAEKQALHETVRDVLSEATQRAPEEYSHQMGWVRIALGNAIYQLVHAASLEEGVVDTVMRGGDTDTNAAIAGALLGAVHGREAVPKQWRDRVLSCRPLEGLPAVRHPRPRGFWPVDALPLAERLVVLGTAQAHA